MSVVVAWKRMTTQLESGKIHFRNLEPGVNDYDYSFSDKNTLPVLLFCLRKLFSLQ